MSQAKFYHYLCELAPCCECGKRVERIELNLYGGICRHCKTGK